MQSISNFTEIIKNPHILKGTFFDETKLLKKYEKENDDTSLFTVYSNNLILSYIFNNKEKSLFYTKKCDKYIKGNAGLLGSLISNFYTSLTLLSSFEEEDVNKKDILKRVKKNQKQMQKWVKYAPMNFLNNYYLVEAEKFRVLGKPILAKDFYEKAIFEAQKNNFLNEEAISWEVAGRFYINQKNITFAKIYLQNAYQKYKTWGAFAKLKQLEEKYPQFIFEKENTKSSSFTNKNRTIISSTATAIGTSSSSFDLESIVKASQSLSGEVKLEKLLKSILMIIMENAGADYAVIIKNDNENFTIEAKGKYGFENITVLQSENLDTSKSVILNMVKYVIRTKKSVLIDDISKNKDYENDEYLKNRKLKSVFCYPIIHKNKMVAILYLENSASSYAFTEERIKTINILSSQIAVSIENALLYENLENKVNQRTKDLSLANSKLKIIFKSLSKQKEKIEISHKHIKDSINYAKKIQDAILPSLDLFENNLSDYFIFFKPRDVVSGDFYWAKKINEHFIFVAADCTGHGVPGAFVSMLGISFLNEIVARKGLYQAGKILDILREEIKKSLKQNSESKRQEGMDIAFCSLNTKTNVLQFAGANNPLYLFRNNEMIEYKGNKQPIGIYRKEKSFTNYEIQLEKEDKIYIFSDGFIDQFGGKKNKKFMKKNFKKLLSEIQNENMNKQKQIINNTFENWKGNYKQIDDVLVMGVKI